MFFLKFHYIPFLATSTRECYKSTNQQQSSPLILPTLKRKENEQITLLTSLAQLTTSSQVWQQYFHTRQILLAKNYEEYFDNFPLYKYHFTSYHKIQDAIVFSADSYLELATAACQQLLSSSKDDE
ncbi:unnamed protein product [Adineta steineri]|uniref:Uncharacterized protein n=1 Tax=Adineta steineri TaxID=433720 RepID=A0A815P261_9BILA|nr:unnamed protein product [Adineta steineri]CAF4306080.1 unnamed protein product [Adineta steineri]